MTVSLVGILAALAAGEPPRYGPAVGQELRYAAREGVWFDGKDGKPDVPKNGDGTPKYTTHPVTVRVTSKRADGAFRVLFETKSLGSDRPILAQAYLWPDGRMEQPASAAAGTEFDSPRLLFPHLPPGDKAASWEDRDARTGIHTRLTLAGRAIRAEFAGPLDRVSEGQYAAVYRLADADRGSFPESVEVAGRWKRYKETHDGRLTLEKVIAHDAEWAAAADAEADRLFAAVEASSIAWGGNVVPRAVAARSPEGLEPILDRAKAALERARDASKDEWFRKHLDRRLADDARFRKGRVESAERFGKIADRPSPDWKANDLAGVEHTPGKYQGKAVVLDLFFRQCSWCIRAMPQVEQAAEHLKATGKPVAFLGVCTDPDPADAQAVADVVGLRYPVLTDAKSVAEAYNITSFPTLIVLDGEGVVRGIFSGYSSKLRDELVTCVDRITDRPTP